MAEGPRSRKRPTVSCVLCRRRKIRCNREMPCSNCMRSKTGSCVYETQLSLDQRLEKRALACNQPQRDLPEPIVGPTMPSRVSTTNNLSSRDQPTDGSNYAAFELEAMRTRITELEDKLSRASSSVTHSPFSDSASTPASTHSVRTVSYLATTVDVLEDTRSPNGISISRGVAHKNRVFGQSHWMNGFIMFRQMIEMIEPHLRTGSMNCIADIQRAKKLARIIKASRSPAWPTQPCRDLPPKPLCDQLVAAYLRTTETLYRVLHVPSFQRAYEDMWNNDTVPSMSFVVMVKLVLAIGATFYDDNMPLRAEATRWVYEAQTWLSSPSFKSQLGIQYLQNSILLLLARELVGVGEAFVWISLGSVYRTAVYIGLHKDPSQLPAMTTLEAEMRRRMWNTVLELSLQMSMMSGGPPLISQEEYNTAPPGNFDDEDLLRADPVAAHDRDFTQTSVAIALRKTLPVRLAILKFLNDIASSGTYEETLHIDGMLRSASKSLRRTLHSYSAGARSPSQFTLQAVEFIMQRYTTCLHFPFFASGLKDPRFAYSRKATVESSLKICNIAHPVWTESVCSVDEMDVDRLCRCGSGFFREYAFFASLFLTKEWTVRVQDDEEDEDMMSSRLKVVVEQAASWALDANQAGETGVKGYLVLCLHKAWIDATKRRANRPDFPLLLVEALRRALDVCVPLLETIASTQVHGLSAHGANGLEGVEKGDFEFPAEDWDTVMWETFNMEDIGSFDAFMP
ncbi:hypothetical protein COCC4DRAFT_59578 [Bipolaris maydis ATCC 48331]|uniref:Zn(2)-C6 fungal-type domain-containing protein n=2 Tax=Cochliobolus heterostrophus TaxID=5016 RepID=M2SLD7_COCH5|nr:uncharacterized protein COCC4DRAFT_59578 [Bipolaris maydis ATCC 48331]EMD86155.1 hypothetical protein COCHEDRAFT_1186016 [Bipolaris maydis C5]KAJ5030157.1 hypothetical protein J3E73DRAFT_225027 [Bipolaris maydis]ENI06104.1 hypothetical protein COCC4DRAFT_59578 [Bipolaris maydis ATCC 48331]KAJ6213795.1 hypothetical protein PSV09DRAFT_1186016 [Bipolaris maydis]KAJ6275003.1 hypothetical protein PSV08DRAFT_407485 [Bipolaris maydis]